MPRKLSSRKVKRSSRSSHKRVSRKRSSNSSNSKTGKYAARYSKSIVDAINHQINMELKAGYVYQLMASWCAQSNMALPGFESLFVKQSADERSHAQQFIDYQTKRGFQFVHKDVKITDIKLNTWKHPLDLLQAALRLEKMVTDHIYHLTDLATKNNEHQLVDWLGVWLNEQIDSVKSFNDLITTTKRAGSDHGLYILDQALLKTFGDSDSDSDSSSDSSSDE
jgi:ferritin